MALDIKPTRSELIKLKARIKQTKNGYKLLEDEERWFVP